MEGGVVLLFIDMGVNSRAIPSPRALHWAALKIQLKLVGIRMHS